MKKSRDTFTVRFSDGMRGKLKILAAKKASEMGKAYSMNELINDILKEKVKKKG